MAAGLAAVFSGQVLPPGTGLQHPQDALQGLAVIGPPPPSGLRRRKEGGDADPLLIGQHPLHG